MKLFKKRRKSLVDEMEKAFMDEAKQIEKEIDAIDLPEFDSETKERMRQKILEEAMRTEQNAQKK